MKRFFAILTAFLAGSLPLFAEEPAEILFLYGGRSHASGAHEFKAGSMLLAKCLEEQKAVPVKCQTHPGWPKDNLALLDSADLIVFYNDATKIVGQGWEKVDALAKKGTGLMFMHYAVHPGVAEGEKYFKPWMGGYFKNGESVNPFWKATIKALPDHETARGVGDISTIDEWYHSISFEGANAKKVRRLGVAVPTRDNIATINNLWSDTGFKNLGTEQPLLWGLEREDGGRGVGFTGGHFHHNWAYDELRQLVLNSIVWAAGKEVPKEGVPVKPLTEDELNANLDDYGNATARIALPTKENRPKFQSNPILTVDEHKNLKKGNPEWLKRKKEIVNSLIVPVEK